MRTLIAGGAGFIGSNLSKSFLDKGWSVTCVDNLISGRLKNIEALKSYEDFTFIEHDVCKPLKIREKPKFIFHLASPASPKFYQKHPFKTLNANIKGTKNLLELCREKDATFILASTSEVYGLAKRIPTPESYYGYTNPFGPRSCYDESKRVSESYCYSYKQKYGVDVRVVRIFNTYGPGMRPDDGRVVTNFITQALSEKPITVYGGGDQTRSFCYIKDLVRGLIKTCEETRVKGEVINLGNPEEVKIKYLAELVKEFTGSSSKIVHEELPEDDPVRRCPDISKAKKLLRWEPRIGLRKGLRRTIQSFN